MAELDKHLRFSTLVALSTPGGSEDPFGEDGFGSWGSRPHPGLDAQLVGS